MSKLSHTILFCFLFFSQLFAFNSAFAQFKYPLYVTGVDRDSVFLRNELGIPGGFISQFEAQQYIALLPSKLHSKGFITSSIDSIRYDSSAVYLVIYVGQTFHWAELNVSQIDPSILNATGWHEKNFSNQPMDFEQLQSWQQKMLDWLENNGYPFGKVYLDSFQITETDKVKANLKLDKGPLYKIDSIRIFGDANISNEFLQRYLEIPNGSPYNKKKLQQIQKKISELSYVEQIRPAELSMLPSGSVLNVYLNSKRSSQVNLLIGILPNNDQNNNKVLITGEGNLNLKNAFGSGETIGLSFQKLQKRSQRLNLLYQHPYIFKLPVGLDFAFDMYRNDSSYVNINLQFGVNSTISATQSGRVYLQRFETIVNSFDASYVVNTHQLPSEADLRSFSFGIDYLLNTTDYSRNPRRGLDFLVATTIGSKKVKKSNQVAELTDPNDPNFDFESLYDTVKLNTYQFRIKTTVAKYFPVGKQSTFKTAVNAGIFQSGNIYRNELFQIGGFRLLRGFDEESQYLSQYVIGTLEYHYLIGQNSYFYGLFDGGWGRNNSQNADFSHTYLSTGVGLAFETGFGIFNLAWAIGKRDDIPFNFRQSKIHFGYLSYF